MLREIFEEAVIREDLEDLLAQQHLAMDQDPRQFSELKSKLLGSKTKIPS